MDGAKNFEESIVSWYNFTCLSNKINVFWKTCLGKIYAINQFAIQRDERGRKEGRTKKILILDQLIKCLILDHDFA